MKLFNKKSTPLLVDQNIIGEYMKQKYSNPIQIIDIPKKESMEIQKLFTKIIYNILNFLYNYFFIIAILVSIVIYLYHRYTWYQQIKKLKDKQKEKESNEIKTYFDNILSEDNKSTNILQQITTPINNNKSNKSNISIKMDKVIGNNNSYLNHLKDSFEANAIQNSNTYKNISIKPQDISIKPQDISIANTKIGMSSRYGLQTEQKNIPNKTVRFIEDDFDAYGRNNINPKTGEILAFNENNSYSMF